MAEQPYHVAPPIEAKLLKSEKIKRVANQDRFYIVTGHERSGKSLLARQFACRIDPNFSLKDICFTSDEFAKRIREKERYGAVIFDEANNGLSSRGAISKENKKLLKLLQECGQLNLTIFIILPSVFLLEKYVVLFRSHTLFHVMISKKDHKRRFYKVYNKKNKKLLYMLGQKYMSYSKPRIYKKYRFYSNQPPQINEAEYDKKKLDAFRNGEKKQDEDSKFKRQRDILIWRTLKHSKFKATGVSKWLKEADVPLEVSYLRNISQQHEKLNKNNAIL